MIRFVGSRRLVQDQKVCELESPTIPAFGFLYFLNNNTPQDHGGIGSGLYGRIGCLIRVPTVQRK